MMGFSLYIVADSSTLDNRRGISMMVPEWLLTNSEWEPTRTENSSPWTSS